MKFALQLTLKNCIKKPFRAIVLALLVMFLSLAMFGGAAAILSLKKGLNAYEARLGADVVVVPYSATSHGTVDDILLSGITGNYYMTGKQVDKICAVEGIEQVTTQFYLTSAKASCCSSRVQIIGIDPETDFVIEPWINESYSGTLADGELIVGSNVTMPADRTVTFYGENYYVAAQLAETGTGLDSAVYANMATVRKMAEDAKTLAISDAFEGVSIGTAASAVFIKVADGYTPEQVADNINIHISKVEASASKSMISAITSGLDNVAGMIGILTGVIWVLAIVILIVVFMLVANERRKEFAVLRLIGASRKQLREIIGTEAALLSGAGALVGILVALLLLPSLYSSLRTALSLPVVTPGAGTIILLAVGALILSMLAGLAAAFLSARRIMAGENGLLLREDT